MLPLMTDQIARADAYIARERSWGEKCVDPDVRRIVP